jgi:V/A-type H+-transporting ATPase subunit I
MHAVTLVAQPEEGEMPPVELRNGRFSKLFEPISKLFDLPNYGEMDLTPYFAPFFMLFFGFCLGDAGYGVFFILFATIMKPRVKKEMKPILSLTQYLGVATILFGLISGTFFGVNLIDSGYTLTASSMEQIQGQELPAGVVAELQGLEGEYFKSREDFSVAVGSAIGEEALAAHETSILKSAEAGLPFVGRFRHLMQDSLSMFYLSILIGGIQIIFGIFVRIFNITRQRGFEYALSTMGWFILLVTLVLNATVLGEEAGRYIFYALLGISGVLIFFMNNPDKNIFVQFGAGIWDTYGMVTGIFGDLLSYIRLFALGISSAILGFVFNDISLQLLNIPVVGWLLFLVLLLAGHSINLFLATLGGFIHPMRLTFVEFYKNAGFQGGGKKYHPFTIHN